MLGQKDGSAEPVSERYSIEALLDEMAKLRIAPGALDVYREQLGALKDDFLRLPLERRVSYFEQVQKGVALQEEKLQDLILKHGKELALEKHAHSVQEASKQVETVMRDLLAEIQKL